MTGDHSSSEEDRCIKDELLAVEAAREQARRVADCGAKKSPISASEAVPVVASEEVDHGSCVEDTGEEAEETSSVAE